MVRSLSLSAQNGSRWINGTDAGTFAWAQNCFYFLFFYNKIQSKIPYVLMTTQWIGHCFKQNIFIWKNWALSRGNWVFFLKTFGYLPFQSISDVTNIMFGIPFACQSSELLPTVRKPCLPTLPHAKRCSIQVPPKTSFHFHFLFHFLKTFSIPGTSWPYRQPKLLEILQKGDRQMLQEVW